MNIDVYDNNTIKFTTGSVYKHLYYDSFNGCTYLFPEELVKQLDYINRFQDIISEFRNEVGLCGIK